MSLAIADSDDACEITARRRDIPGRGGNRRLE